jgi:elongation factor Ts
MALREETGMGMMECKKALTETDGDIAKAKELLRERAHGKMEKRTERTTGEGRIGIAIDGSQAAIVEIRTESDFTAKSDGFVKMADDVAQLALAQPAGDLSCTDDMAKRIDDQRFTTKENMSFSRGLKLEGGAFGKYVHHDGKRGVLLQIDGTADEFLLKGLCQHICFHDPLGISEDDIPADDLEHVRAEAIAEAQASGKPEEIAQKIAEGKVRKYLEEKTLLKQKYVLDETTTVEKMLPGDVAIKRFIRYTLGVN